MDFSGKSALITGAAVGIGRATALEMARMGAELVLFDVDAKGLEELCLELKGICKTALSYVCDISDEQTVRASVADAIAKLGKIDILVNNAALWRWKSPFVQADMTLWRQYFDVNVTGTALVTQAVLPSMIAKGYGRIVNVSSVAGVYGIANMACYSATKGAVIAFTRALAKEVADKRILVNAVSPGSVSPSTNKDIDHYIPSDLSFLGRSGTDRENANLICFLASDDASYISGQSIQIDGCRKKQ